MQGPGAGAPAAGGGEDLNLVGGDAHPLGQTAAAQVYHRVQHRLGVPAGQAEEIPLVAPQVGNLPPVDEVGAADDGALCGLTENLRQPDRGNRPAADEVGEEGPRPHRWQLVRVSHQHQAAPAVQGVQQGGHQGHVHHRGLVHDNGVGL